MNITISIVSSKFGEQNVQRDAETISSHIVSGLQASEHELLKKLAASELREISVDVVREFAAALSENISGSRDAGNIFSMSAASLHRHLGRVSKEAQQKSLITLSSEAVEKVAMGPVHTDDPIPTRLIKSALRAISRERRLSQLAERGSSSLSVKPLSGIMPSAYECGLFVRHQGRTSKSKDDPERDAILKREVTGAIFRQISKRIFDDINEAVMNEIGSALAAEEPSNYALALAQRLDMGRLADELRAVMTMAAAKTHGALVEHASSLSVELRSDFACDRATELADAESFARIAPEFSWTKLGALVEADILAAGGAGCEAEAIFVPRDKKAIELEAERLVRLDRQKALQPILSELLQGLYHELSAPTGFPALKKVVSFARLSEAAESDPLLFEALEEVIEWLGEHEKASARLFSLLDRIITHMIHLAGDDYADAGGFLELARGDESRLDRMRTILSRASFVQLKAS